MRLKQMMAALVAASALLLSPQAAAYEKQIGNSVWSYDMYQTEEGKWYAYVSGYRQVDENGNQVEPTADFALTVPDSFTLDWTNEYVKVSERVYDEYGNFLSNNYVTVRGPEIKSVTAPVKSVYVGNSVDWDWEYDESTSNYVRVVYYNYLGHLTSLTLPDTVGYVSGFNYCTNLAAVTMSEVTEFSADTFANSPYRKNFGEFIIRNGTLIAYQGEASAVTVPDGVIVIGERAFSPNWTYEFRDSMATILTGVTLPASVKTIEYSAFEGCENLVTINLPEGLTYIGEYAFSCCYSLTDVLIPTRVKYIGWHAFAETSIGSIVVPAGVDELSDGVFAYCTNLTSVTLPASLEYVGEDAFCCCSALASIVLPSGVEEIDYGAFRACESLASITMPSSLKWLGDSAFQGCESLATITLPSSLKEIGSHAFSYCEKLATVTLPSSLEELGYGAFFHCTALTSVALPDALVYIDDEAFYFCTNLATVAGGAGVTSVGYDAFGETALERNLPETGFYQAGTLILGYNGVVPAKLAIPSGATYIRNNAFSGSEVEELDLPSSVHTIGYDAFADTSITNVTGGNGLKHVGNNVFRSWWYSDSLFADSFRADRGNKDVPFGFVSVGSVIFGYKGVCPATVTIPANATQIMESLFDRDFDGSVSNITTAVIGANLEELPEYAFYGAENLATVTFGASLKRIKGYAFYGCQGLTTLELPSTLESIYEYPFSYCTNLTSVTGGGSIKSVYEAFRNCPNLTDVSLAGPLTRINYLFGGDSTNIVNVTFTQTEIEPDDEDEDPYFTDFYLSNSEFDGLDSLESVKVLRTGYELMDWAAWAIGPERETFANELDTFKLKYKYWNIWYDYEYNPQTDNWEYFPHSGWAVNPLGLYAQWKRVLRNVETDGPFNSADKSVYSGWLTDDSGNIVGAVTVTAAKGKNGVSNTKVVVQVVGDKKVTLKGSVDANGNGTGDLAGLKLGASGLTGSLKVNGAVYTADGARDVNKTKGDSGQSALAALKDRAWTVVLQPIELANAYANGYLGFSVSMGSKGKAKVKAVLPSGAKVSANAQAIVGETGFCVPVVSSKKDSIGFLLWLDLDGNATDVTSISDWKSATVSGSSFTVPVRMRKCGTVAPVSGTVPFIVSREDVPESVTGVLPDFLPEYEPISVKSGKWELAKPAVVKYSKGAFDQAAYDKGVAQGKTNVGALKLRYSAKDGSFKGSFKIYQLKDGKLKKLNTTVNGVVCDGAGYGSALIKKIGSMPVEIGDAD